MKEPEVTSAVEDYFRSERYFVIRGKFNVGVKPDVVAFKWADDYRMKCVAVECKGKVSRQTIVNVALKQAISYQKFFPEVYIACPSLNGTLGNWLKVLFKVGFIPVSNKGVEKSNIIEAEMSPRLADKDFIIHVRNRAALLLAYRDIFGSGFEYGTDVPGYIWCSTQKGLGFTTNNYHGAFYAGVNIELAEQVRKSLLKVSTQKLYSIINNLPPTYFLHLRAIETYRPRLVEYTLLRKQVRDLTKEDVSFIIEEAKRRHGRICLQINRIVWDESEILSRRDYQARLKEAYEEVRPLLALLTS